jgi:hypothetical protein
LVIYLASPPGRPKQRRADRSHDGVADDPVLALRQASDDAALELLVDLQGVLVAIERVSAQRERKLRIGAGRDG